MENFWKSAVWGQFGAAIDMLARAIEACPSSLWSEPAKTPEWPDRDVPGFWYLAYHSLFWLDFYLSEAPRDFLPPEPFTLGELDPAGVLPERPYSREELLAYLAFCREKCRNTVEAMTEQKAAAPCPVDWLDISAGELLLYGLRHVQHHVGQMNLLLRQATGSAPRWVASSKLPRT